jgi:predicted enzyme related to lactoylglutathione lyase
MAVTQGDFVWYELMTTDRAAAKAFYGKVVGWGAEDADMPGMTYTMFMAGESMVAGLMDMPRDAKPGTPPNWMGYVGVDDVDASAAKVTRLGGAVHVQPMDIPNVGRFSVVGDPGGAVFALFKWTAPPSSAVPTPMSPGRIGWHELMAADGPKAYEFYSDLFGWQKAEAMDMGAMGVYQLVSNGGPPMGAMFTKPAAVPMPFWLYYFGVDGIDAAAGRVTQGGGKIVNGPMEVPGGSWIVQCIDPQGAMFALVGPKG